VPFVKNFLENKLIQLRNKRGNLKKKNHGSEKLGGSEHGSVKTQNLFHADIIFPISFIEETISECSWHPCQKSVRVYVKVYFWILNSDIFIYMSVLLRVPHS
jgi:hypothetical protein